MKPHIKGAETAQSLTDIILNISLNPLTSRPECMPGSRYTGVRVLFFVI